jgi:N-acetylmuramic acid 6-phosphate etherase
VKNASRGPLKTEHGNPRSRGLDLRSTAQILRVMNREDAGVARAVARELPAIARAVEAIVKAIQSGGRLIYVGAGTSGRLAMLDASECAPTFGVPRALVQGVLAGGRRAFTGSVEDAEDSRRRGAQDLAARKLSARDVVVGISASGTTPYVLGALEHARRKRATGIGIVSNRHSPLTRLVRITIAPQTGPEVISGSTRLKAGTAQKMVLNMLSTTAMARLGHVYDNWMIDVVLVNQKLRERGLRMLVGASGTSVSRAEHALRQAGYSLRVALVMLKGRCDAASARRRLKLAKNHLRRALGE